MNAFLPLTALRSFEATSRVGSVTLAATGAFGERAAGVFRVVVREGGGLPT